jgi:hypothetical protein
MAVHVEEMTSEVSAFDADLPLSEAQLDKLARVIMQRIERRRREDKLSAEATTLRAHSVSLTHGD